MMWENVKLGEIAPSRKSKKEISPHETVWNLTLDQIESETGHIVGKQFITASSASQSSSYVDENNVLYSKLRPYLNKVIIPDSFAVATTELVPLYPDKSKLDNTYLLYYLRSKKFVDWASGVVSGAKMPRVVMKKFWAYKIPLPPLKTQKRIVALLDKAQALIDKRKEQIALMDQLIQSLFYDMFGDPVINPKGWEICKIKNVVDIRGRVGWKGYKKTDLRNSGPLVLGATHLTKEGNINLKSPVFISNEKYEESPEIVIKVGDLLIVQRGNTIGKVGAITEDIGKATINPCILIMRPKKVDINYLRFYFVNEKINQKLWQMNNSSAQPMLTQKDLNAFNIPFPPLGLQSTFAQKVQKIEIQKEAMTASLKELEDNFNALMQRAFKGEL
ncbi:restriction endonuclease subunit S [Desulfococcaceae bacterium HSG9]|nr:restriction endonuclease subunit S [Desulfococcaceae bacterium HSG9]